MPRRIKVGFMVGSEGVEAMRRKRSSYTSEPFWVT